MFLHRLHFILSLVFFATSFTTLSASAEVREIHWNFDFGSIPAGQSKKLTWGMRAKDQELAIKDITVSGQAYSFQTNCVNPLPPKERCLIEITASPATLGIHTGLLTVDLHGEKFLIQLSVEGH